MTPADPLWLAIVAPIAAYLILLAIAFLLLVWMIYSKSFPFV
jgi:hypothetical protein